MGLPVRQRRVLEHIERALRGSDPRLAALYAIFGRLAQGEDMPRFEQLRYGLLARLSQLGVILAVIAAHLHLRPHLRPRQKSILCYPLAIALTVGAIMLAARSGSDRACLPTRTVAAAKNVGKSSLCRPGVMTPVLLGR